MDDLIEACQRALKICAVCEGEGTVADGLDEDACSIECPRCFGQGWDARAVIPLVLLHSAKVADGFDDFAYVEWPSGVWLPCNYYELGSVNAGERISETLRLQARAITGEG